MKKMLILLGLLMMTMMVMSVTANLGDGLVAYYSMDNGTDLIDSTGVWNISQIGEVGNFSGKILDSRGEMNLSNYFRQTSYFETDDTKDITFNFWAKIDSLTAITPIFFTYGGGSEGKFKAQLFANDVTIEPPLTYSLFFGVYNDYIGGGSCMDGNFWDDRFGEWVMITAQYSSNGSIYLYADGVLIDEQVSDISGTTPANEMVIGNSIFEETNPIYQLSTGYMDEFGIWNRTLSQEEITSLYNSGAGLSYSEITAEPVSYPTAPQNFYVDRFNPRMEVENYFTRPDGEITDWGVFFNRTGWREADYYNHTIRMRVMQAEVIGNPSNQMQVSAGVVQINETETLATFMTDINVVDYGISNESYGAVFQGDSRWNYSFFQLRFRNDSYVTCIGNSDNESTPSVTYNESEWNTYKVVMDIPNNRYSAWKNDELICANWSAINGWDGYLETRFFVNGDAVDREVLWDNVLIFHGETIPPNVGFTYQYDLNAYWNKSTTNQSNITSYCRMENEGMVCGSVPPEPAVDVIYQFQYSNTSGVSWFDLFPFNYSGCPICPDWTGGYWQNETAFLNESAFPQGNGLVRIRAFDGFAYSDWVESDPLRVCFAEWNCTESNSTCQADDMETCLVAQDISGCGFGNMNSNFYIEFNQWLIANRSACDYCTPDWNCTGYSATCVGGHLACNETNDSMDCYSQTGLGSDLYLGNYSEFTPENCTMPPPITGYVASFGTGDLPKLTFDIIGNFLLEIISLIGLIVAVVLFVLFLKRFRVIGKGGLTK